MSKDKPLISVLVPTGGRVNTLPFTLRTILSQPSDAFEVIVSDNSTSDRVVDVLRDIADPRLRYVRTDRRLPMCDSYEFAVSHAQGRYLTIIGDDDALAVNAIPSLEALIRTQPSPIYHWDSPIYRWPGEGMPPALVYRPRHGPTRRVSLRPLVEFAFRWGGLRYVRLPLLYHALVERSLLDALRARTGRLFHSMCPDVFMAFALPVFSDESVFVGDSLTIYGVTYDTAYTRRMARRSSAFSEKTLQFVKEYGAYRLHPSLYPGVPPWANMIPDTMLVARDLFPDYYQSIPFDYDAMWAFMWRYWRFETILGIASLRRKIRPYHPFHTWRYLLFAGAHVGSECRMAFRRALRLDPSMVDMANCPDNIADLARMLAAG